MAEVISVRFKEVGKNYYFDPQGLSYKRGDKVVVETARGIELGEVTVGNREISDENITAPLKPVIRMADAKDLKVAEDNKKKEKQAFDICVKRIAAHGLEMSLVDTEYSFDGSKIIFYFTADNRVDFRALVRDLAGIFHTRIELRQIGVRDHSKRIGGLGVCGRPFCCNTFLSGFQPVTIKMAKEQSLFLSTAKISGTCGRLMCCLKYEQDTYEHLYKITPKTGSVVDTKDGRGTVVDFNLLTGILKVKLDKAPDAVPVSVDRKDVKVIRDAKMKFDESAFEGLEE